MNNIQQYNFINEFEQNMELQFSLQRADKYINKNYLVEAHEHQVVEFNENSNRDVRFVKLQKFVYDDTENINDKLISVFGALQDININSNVFLIIDKKYDDVDIYLGVKAKSVSKAETVLEKMFIGNFPGSDVKKQISDRRILRNMGLKLSYLQDQIFPMDVCEMDDFEIASVTIVPATRDEDKEKFVQGMEKFIEVMNDDNYTAVIIAEPVTKRDLSVRKRGLEHILSALSPFGKTTFTYGENSSRAVGSSLSDSVSRGISWGISESVGTSSGSNGGGYSFSQNYSNSSNTGKSYTSTHGKTTSDTTTEGDSKSFGLEYHNSTVENMSNKLQEQLQRIKESEAFGVWNCCAYFISRESGTARKFSPAGMAANAYKALMLGDKTSVENNYVNLWESGNDNVTEIYKYLRNGMHPIFTVTDDDFRQEVTLANYISGKELPLLLGLPHKSVPGLTVSHIAEFGRNVLSSKKNDGNRILSLGKIYHMGKEEEKAVDLDIDSFTSHCFVTGSTGSGKSNTTYTILENLLEQKIPFLVIEPAKGEYKDVFSKVDGINILTTNIYLGQMLKLNPFRFAPEIHILEHLDKLIEIFNACWEMYAAMPAILKDAVEAAYIDKGWDLLNSVYTKKGAPQYPNFEDVLKQLPKKINESSYSAEAKGNYTGSLVTRVKSLTNGVFGQIFCDCYDIPDEVLFDQNTIVDLSRLGSTETKALLMGILVMKLQEYRVAKASQSNSKLKHVTVLEEAHNLLKNTSAMSNDSNVVAKSVEMLCNGIAEMRTYGEGFVIVDQSPTAVDIAAIKNTNTKIVMRLPEKYDCEAVGNAVGLNEDQIKEIAKLGTGIAVVMQNNWEESVLAKVNKNRAEELYYNKIEYAKQESLVEVRSIIAKTLVDCFFNDKENGGKIRTDAEIVENLRNLPFDEIKMAVSQSDLNEFKQKDFFVSLDNMKKSFEEMPDAGSLKAIAREYMFNITMVKGAFDVAAQWLKETKPGSKEYTNGSTWRPDVKNLLKSYLSLDNWYIDRFYTMCVVKLKKSDYVVNFSALDAKQSK